MPPIRKGRAYYCNHHLILSTLMYTYVVKYGYWDNNHMWQNGYINPLWSWLRAQELINDSPLYHTEDNSYTFQLKTANKDVIFHILGMEKDGFKVELKVFGSDFACSYGSYPVHYCIPENGSFYCSFQEVLAAIEKIEDEPKIIGVIWIPQNSDVNHLLDYPCEIIRPDMEYKLVNGNTRLERECLLSDEAPLANIERVFPNFFAEKRRRIETNDDIASRLISSLNGKYSNGKFAVADAYSHKTMEFCGPICFNSEYILLLSKSCLDTCVPTCKVVFMDPQSHRELRVRECVVDVEQLVLSLKK